MNLLWLYVLLALGVSFVCSVMEAVLLTVTPSFVALLEQEGKAVARPLKKLKANIDRPLVAILTLNTIAHTVGAAGAGAQAAVVFGDEWLGVFSGVLTLLILVASEIIPKTLGATQWRRLAGVVTRTLVVIIYLLFPLVVAMEGLTKLLSRGRKKGVISREEMQAMAKLGAEQGALDAEESSILANLFRFSSLRAQDVMTPRTVVFGLEEATTVGSAIQARQTIRFSRLPVFQGGLDEITGFVLKDTIFLEAAKGHNDRKLAELKRPIRVLPVTTPLPRALETMLGGRDHIALVVDEYGGTAGILTTEDIVETLLGLEIIDELDTVEDMQAYARDAWSKRAKALGLLAEQNHGVTDD